MLENFSNKLKITMTQALSLTLCLCKKLTSITSDMHPHPFEDYLKDSAKWDIILQRNVVLLGVKNSRDVRATQWREECVDRVRCDSTTGIFTTISWWFKWIKCSSEELSETKAQYCMYSSDRQLAAGLLNITEFGSSWWPLMYSKARQLKLVPMNSHQGIYLQPVTHSFPHGSCSRTFFN